MADTSRPDPTAELVLNATRARQGRYGRHMFWVLIIGTALAAIGLALAWTWKAPSFSAADSGISANHSKQAPSFAAPEPAPVTVQQGSDHTAPQQP